MSITISGASLVREARRKLGLSQEDFAVYMERNPMTISRYERGLLRPSWRFETKCEQILLLTDEQVRAQVARFHVRRLQVTDGQ